MASWSEEKLNWTKSLISTVTFLKIIKISIITWLWEQNSFYLGCNPLNKVLKNFRNKKNKNPRNLCFRIFDYESYLSRKVNLEKNSFVEYSYINFFFPS